ncbi:hypothetical protein BH20ACT4_BH20ACT4_13250 [soil metagenome]
MIPTNYLADKSQSALGVGALAASGHGPAAVFAVSSAVSWNDTELMTNTSVPRHLGIEPM